MISRPAEIVVGVTGSIGAYKAADLIRRLKERGHAVTAVLTREACEFIAPLTLQVLSGRKAYTDLFSDDEAGVVHTTIADRAALVVIAPATANVIAKLAHGLADDLLTCIVLATKAPLLVAPAMNVHMYEHPIVRQNVQTLRRLGHEFIGPATGALACGYEGVGHLVEPDEIVRAAERILAAGPRARKAAARRPRRS